MLIKIALKFVEGSDHTNPIIGSENGLHYFLYTPPMKGLC